MMRQKKAMASYLNTLVNQYSTNYTSWLRNSCHSRKVLILHGFFIDFEGYPAASWTHLQAFWKHLALSWCHLHTRWDQYSASCENLENILSHLKASLNGNPLEEAKMSKLEAVIRRNRGYLGLPWAEHVIMMRQKRAMASYLNTHVNQYSTILQETERGWSHKRNNAYFT